jgi:hypothetical protein
VQGLGQLSGSLKLISTTQLVGATTVTELSIGFDSLTGTLGLGGVGASLANGRGAVLLRNEVTGTSVVKRYAVAAEGDVALTGVSGVELSLNDMHVGWSRWGQDLDTTVRTATGTYAVSLSSGEARLRGLAHANIADVLTLDGEVFIESQENASVTLTDGSTVSVSQLILGGAGIAAMMGTASVGAQLSGANLAVVLSTERGGSQRRWMTAKGSLESATLQGYAMAEVSQASVEVNRILGPGGDAFGGTGPVINWSGAKQRTVTLDDTHSVVLNDAGPVFKVSARAALQMGPAVLGGQFDIALDQQANGARTWQLGVTEGYASVEANGARSGSVTGDAAVTGVQGLT